MEDKLKKAVFHLFLAAYEETRDFEDAIALTRERWVALKSTGYLRPDELRLINEIARQAEEM